MTTVVNLNFTFSPCYGLKRKPTTVKNLQANAILEHIHQTLAPMMCSAEFDMVNSVDPSDIDDFLNNVMGRLLYLPYST
jgi:hypothetical protein